MAAVLASKRANENNNGKKWPKRPKRAKKIRCVVVIFGIGEYQLCLLQTETNRVKTLSLITMDWK